MKPLDSALRAPIPDVQGSRDARRIPIDRVGISDLRHPLRVGSGEHIQHTVATVAMAVGLPHDVKGTHMSRFVDVLNRFEAPVNATTFGGLLELMVARLEADHGYLELRFPYFIAKTAPVSGLQSLLDYQVALRGELAGEGPPLTTVEVVVPVKSLCPCSKEISTYGAHNQRSHITAEVTGYGAIPLEELIAILEAQGSSELFGLLKRSDEKWVTERAYDNPKFVEDIVRDVGSHFNDDGRIRRYKVTVENFESIHNHTAFAVIERDKDR